METMNRWTGGRVAGLVPEAILQLRLDPARRPEISHPPTNRLGASHIQRSANVLASVLALLLACLVPAHFATAQSACSPGWLPGSGVPGVNDTVNAMVMWDPDGPGPRAPVLVVGGEFTVAGDRIAKSVATWDPATGAWAAMGSFPGYATVNALAVLPTGELIAGGLFRYPTGYAGSGIAPWRGGAWQLVDDGPAGTVHALAVLPTGVLVAAGQFYNAGTTLVGNIARWDGTETGAWLPMGEGFATGVEDEVYALAVLPSGDLVAAGDFFVRGPVFSINIARWDGVAWSALGEGLSGIVYSLAALPNGDLAAGGSFARAGDVFVGGIARWDGSTWSAFASAASSEVDTVTRCIVRLPGGEVLIGGRLSFDAGASVTGIARWSAADGGTWMVPGTGIDGTVRSALIMPDGGIIAAGTFTRAGQAKLSNIARFDGAEPGTWSTLSSGTNGDVRAFAVLPNGNLIAAGEFTSMFGTPANHIAILQGDTWSPLGSGLENPIIALAVLHNGDIVAASSSTNSAGSLRGDIHRWNGSAWTPLAPQFDGRISAMAVLPNGDLIAAGYFTQFGDVAANNIARWDGLVWSPLGSGITRTNFYDYVQALAVLPDGSLIVGGRFALAGNVPAQTIARWNAATPGGWSTFGTEVIGGVSSLLVLPNGDLIAGGDLYFPDEPYQHSIVRWDGIAWQWIASGLSTNYPPRALATLPSGQLLAGGSFRYNSGFANLGLARYDGTIWTEFDPTIPDDVYALAVLPNGDLVAGGSFSSAGNNASAHFARFPAGVAPPSIAVHPDRVTTCPETIATFSIVPVGVGPFSYQWYKDGVPISGTINPSAAAAVLQIASAGDADVGWYHCVVSNACGSTASDAELLVIVRHADLVGSRFGPDGVTDGNDFIAFINSFMVGDVTVDRTADIVGGGPDGQYSDDLIDSRDFVAFINYYMSGC